MKTLHVDTGREMGGGQWQALYLVEQLKDAVLMTPRDSGLFAEAGKRGLDVRALSMASLARVVSGFDIVHAHDARAHAMAAVLPGVRLVVSRRVAFPVKRGIASRLKYSRAGLYLAVSRYVAGELESAGVLKERIRVVYDGVPPADLARGNDVIAIEKETGLVQRAAELAGVKIGFVSELWESLRTAGIFVYASGMEGLGSAALAASSVGVPVIASDVGGLKEAVEHERTGLLVENRPEAFAAALRRLIEAPDLRKEMGRRGRERIEKQFTIETMAQRTLAAYNQVSGHD